jgi:hypothetical protein
MSKRRTWRKLHLGIDEATGEILVGVVTTNGVYDGTVLKEIVDGMEDPIAQVSVDGVYDHQHCYDEIAERQARDSAPQRCRNLAAWQR